MTVSPKVQKLQNIRRYLLKSFGYGRYIVAVSTLQDQRTVSPRCIQKIGGHAQSKNFVLLLKQPRAVLTEWDYMVGWA
ncbi:hypothetical protein TNCT_537651 [Trichonephila clavata]|uniref:Uncharacterized protein n=1 Tax=Trichonephila clavata TaxID=2740835 RepID=A0A8X6LGN9_TRICU|nr:hypothetical protein TNCT_537651 [Trichonephila clavata]